MDKLETRLREDAEQIRVEVSEELSARIEASIRATDRATDPVRRPGFGFSLWWLSSLTGVAVALAVIVFLNRVTVETPSTQGEPPIASVLPDDVWQLPSEFPLRAETAEFTEPLEEELEKLRSDIEKARDNLEEDLRKSF